jgi:hypothetical protein
MPCCKGGTCVHLCFASMPVENMLCMQVVSGAQPICFVLHFASCKQCNQDILCMSWACQLRRSGVSEHGISESALTLDRQVFSSILCCNTGVPYLPQGSDTHRSCTGKRASQAFQCSPAAQKSCHQSLMDLLQMWFSNCMKLRHFCAYIFLASK